MGADVPRQPTMKYITHIALPFVALVSTMLTSCATQYTSRGFTGGYSDTQLAPDAFRITFSGNGFTSSERTQDFAILRAADLTLSHGFRYFGIVNSVSGGNTSSITLPGQSYTTAQATRYGNTAYGTATTTYMPPTNIPIFKPNTGMLIRCFAERPPDGYVFDAQFLSHSLRTKYGIKA
jgi:hypothetical protein